MKYTAASTVKGGLMLCIFLTVSTISHAQDSLSQSKRSHWLEGSFYTEANYGYNFFGSHRNIYDFPHAVLDLTVHLGRGWHFTTEQEFEYLSDSGDWPHHLSEMYSCNWAYMEKDFSDKLHLIFGILNIPIGLTSSFYGTGLTVYDPLSEGRILPMKWHETAVALTGNINKWEYWIGYIAHLDVKLNKSRSMGAAARVNYRPADGLRVGVNGFIGHGAILSKLTRDGLADDCQHCGYVGADFNYDKGRWIASGEFVYRSVNDDKAIGGEVGYRVTPKVIPFVRYDWLSMPTRADYEVTTAGVNVEPLKNFVLKGQVSQDGSNIRMDASVNYTIEFF